MTNKIHDISLTISPELVVWPGSEQPVIKRVQSMDDGDDCNLTNIAFGAHTGTHLDAPLHFVNHARPIEELDLNALVGPAYVVELGKEVDLIDAEQLQSAGIPEGVERLIIKTRNSDKWENDPTSFNEDYVALAPSAAKWVIERNIKTVGIDHLSIAAFRRDYLVETHVILLEAEVIPIEGLRLSAISPGWYELVCLPLKLKGSDGAPCRAILIEK